MGKPKLIAGGIAIDDSLMPDTKIMFFSTSTLEASKGDDIRFPARLWDIWEVEER